MKRNCRVRFFLHILFGLRLWWRNIFHYFAASNYLRVITLIFHVRKVNTLPVRRARVGRRRVTVWSVLKPLFATNIASNGLVVFGEFFEPKYYGSKVVRECEVRVGLGFGFGQMGFPCFSDRIATNAREHLLIGHRRLFPRSSNTTFYSAIMSRLYITRASLTEFAISKLGRHDKLFKLRPVY